MNDWWKAPILQGSENDYGQYDYMIEELPQDVAKWSWFYSKCDSCGKYHKLNFYSVHHFHTYDGWDSLDYTDCWVCRVKDKIHAVKRKVKREFKAHGLALSLLSSKRTFERNVEMYKLGLKIGRKS